MTTSSTTPLLVVAIGGNALLPRGQPPTIERQRAAAGSAAAPLAAIAADHRLVVVHGNGPQVGALSARDALAGAATPLDVLVAETQGLIGYLLEEAVARAGADLRVVTLLTRVLVDARDPAFAAPTKPIGKVMSAAEAEEHAAAEGWSVARDGSGWRRVVASPEPQEIISLDTIRASADDGVVVVCGGGGGIPVARDRRGGPARGVEAVIDKDLTAALIATGLGATGLLFLTDVDALYSGWGTPDARPIRRATSAELASMDFAAGSMGPKARAACRFVDHGRWAAIGRLDAAPALMEGSAGTMITPA